MAEPLDALIVGGGVAGLATAFEARQRAPSARVLVLEERARPGGNVRTLERDGCVIDLGPDALATQPGEALSLCGALGLSDELVAPSDASRRVAVAHRGALHPMPEGLAMGLPRSPLSLASTSLLSPLGKLRAALDLILPAGEPGERALGKLVRQRLGSQVHENLVAPLVGGIYGGDPDRLDVRVVMPSLAQTRGSLVRALARAPRPAGGHPLRAPRRGMQRLVQALCARLGEGAVRCGQRAVSASREGALWRVRLDDGSAIEARRLVLAAPSHAAARVIEASAPELSSALSEIRARSSASVVFAFDEGDTPEPDSSGFLASKGEGVSFLAATYAGRKWPGRVRPGRVVVRAVVDEERAELWSGDDASLARRALDELRRYVRLGEPAWVHVERHHLASPRPEVGHPERVALARQLARSSGLWLVGASYDGPGLAGCARGARLAAEALAL